MGRTPTAHLATGATENPATMGATVLSRKVILQGPEWAQAVSVSVPRSPAVEVIPQQKMVRWAQRATVRPTLGQLEDGAGMDGSKAEMGEKLRL